MRSNNHYIPKVYLKNWSSDGRTIYRYRLLVSDEREPHWKKESIKSVAKSKDLYSAQIDGVSDDYLEMAFDHELEAKLQPVFGKVIKQEQLGKEDLETLISFVYVQRYRSIPGIQRLKKMAEENYSEVVDTINVDEVVKKYNNGTLIPTEEKEIIKESQKYIPISFDLSKTNQNLLGIETVIGPSIINRMLQFILKEVPASFKQYDWKIVTAADGILFPTSDDPVIFLNYYSDSQYEFLEELEKDTNLIILPLTPKQLFVTRCKIHDKTSYRSKYWSRFFSRIIIEHAYRNVFSYKEIIDIETIKPRVVDSTQLMIENDQLINWFPKGTEMENKVRDSMNKILNANRDKHS